MTDWVHVTSGVVEVAGRRENVGPFEMGRYPVTCDEFERFVDAGGYSEEKWWTQSGWEWLERSNIRWPEFWMDPFWHRPGHPVVGVLWHEAIAYCAWLSEEEGPSVTLPTEFQRDRAARGDEDLPYPWGRFFDQRRCNSAESGIGRTTPVDLYPGGCSPFGVFDMSGNVWEWCLEHWTSIDSAEELPVDSDLRVLRGGSFFDVSLTALSEIRARYRSDRRLPYVGFRIVRNQTGWTGSGAV